MSFRVFLTPDGAPRRITPVTRSIVLGNGSDARIGHYCSGLDAGIAPMANRGAGETVEQGKRRGAGNLFPVSDPLRRNIDA